jgi:NTP pyrophosphatase (non-canonical NTP hydrolase)
METTNKYQCNTFAGLIEKQHEWELANFGKQGPEMALVGIFEELGELSHALLKHEQGIRGFENEDYFQEQVQDAVGDVMIYLVSFCNNLTFFNGSSLLKEVIDQGSEDLSKITSTFLGLIDIVSSLFNISSKLTGACMAQSNLDLVDNFDSYNGERFDYSDSRGRLLIEITDFIYNLQKLIKHLSGKSVLDCAFEAWNGTVSKREWK